MRVALLPGIASLLSACAVTGPPYAQHAANATAVPAHTARLVVFRKSENLQYVVRTAALTFDARDVGRMGPGELKSLDVAPGKHTFIVDMWDVPGRCELTIQVEGGAQYFFEVAPRIANAISTLPMIAVPTDTLPGLLLSGVVMLAGLAAESAAKQCGGAYAIVEVGASEAIPKLAKLRASN